MVIAIGVTAGTASSASDKPGLYVVYIGESSLNIFPLVIRERSKVSVQGVVALDGHFATLCPELDFYEAILFVINFQKEKENTFTVLIILIVKSLQIELHSTNLLNMTPNLLE